jgi:hypothetical protein
MSFARTSAFAAKINAKPVSCAARTKVTVSRFSHFPMTVEGEKRGPTGSAGGFETFRGRTIKRTMRPLNANVTT